MKKLWLLSLLMLLIFTACRFSGEGYDDAVIPEELNGAEELLDEEAYEDDAYENEDYQEYDEYEYVPEVIVIPLPTPAAVTEPALMFPYNQLEEIAEYFARLQAMWDEDDGEMWGMPLHAPVIIFCRITRAFATNMTPAHLDNLSRQYVGDTVVYTGEGLKRLFHYDPYSIILSPWDGRTGIFITRQFIQARYRGTSHPLIPPDRALAALSVINHVALHAIQHELMGFSGGAIPGALASNEVRISIELELRALVHALSSEGETRQAAILDALSIRNARGEALGSNFYFNRHMLGEGAPAYTELHMVFSRDEIIAQIQTWPEYFAGILSPPLVLGQFGYLFGPLYGMLLDDHGVVWRRNLDIYTDIVQLLIEALGITEFLPLDEIDLERYGYSEIVARVRIR